MGKCKSEHLYCCSQIAYPVLHNRLWTAALIVMAFSMSFAGVFQRCTSARAPELQGLDGAGAGADSAPAAGGSLALLQDDGRAGSHRACTALWQSALPHQRLE